LSSAVPNALGVLHSFNTNPAFTFAKTAKILGLLYRDTKYRSVRQ
jgi:hypothetical protein